MTYLNPLRLDPTRTVTARRLLERDLTRRFRALTPADQKALIEFLKHL